MGSEMGSFGQLVYKNRPVKKQDKGGFRKVRVEFYDGTTIFVDEKEWNECKKFVIVPRSLGSRETVVKNWPKYSQLVK